MNIYESIATRTNGDIYVGVVGPVRTGKSTFIAKFMEKLVLPNIKDFNVRQRAEDEMPQSGSGKLIMTMQPKFVPNEAVELNFGDNAKAKVRLIDCVGYLINGVSGHEDGNAPRLVKTPWNEDDIPFAKAAEIGTHKVICEHSTIGILVATDGTVSDLPRENYIEAEERVVNELKQLNKPFVILLNTLRPAADDTIKLATAMQEKYRVPVLVENIVGMETEDFERILERVLLEFPVKQVSVKIPEWMRNLPEENENISKILNEVTAVGFNKMADYTKISKMFETESDIETPVVEELNLGRGEIKYTIKTSNALFYKTLTDITNQTIANDFDLISYMQEATIAKNKYAKLEEALKNVEETGYCVVVPTVNDLQLSEPEMVKRAGNSGVKLKAKAPSLHIMRVDVETEVTPAVGGIGISDGVLSGSEESEVNGIWNTNMFGKSLSELAHDGIVSKIQTFPEEAQLKMRKTLSKITNEGKGGIICILL